MPHPLTARIPQLTPRALLRLTLCLSLCLCAALSGCDSEATAAPASSSPSSAASAPHPTTASTSSAAAQVASASSPPPHSPTIEGAEALDMKTALALRATQRHNTADGCDNDDASHLPSDPVLSRHELADPLDPNTPPQDTPYNPLSLSDDTHDPAAAVSASASAAASASAHLASTVLLVDQTPDDTYVIPQGLPRNTRRVREGYWIGGRPAAEAEIQSLYDSGVRVIISGVHLDEPINKRISALGMRHLRVPFGQEFPDPDKLLAATHGAKSSQIFIHCEHGGDRSGAMVAFFLATRNGWRPDHALLAMTAPNKRDADGQVAMLRQAGLHVSQAELDTYLGIYSGARNGGVGGLKVRDQGYRRLVLTTLRAMAAKGVSLHETPAKGSLASSGSP